MKGHDFRQSSPIFVDLRQSSMIFTDVCQKEWKDNASQFDRKKFKFRKRKLFLVLYYSIFTLPMRDVCQKGNAIVSQFDGKNSILSETEIIYLDSN